MCRAEICLDWHWKENFVTLIRRQGTPLVASVVYKVAWGGPSYLGPFLTCLLVRFLDTILALKPTLCFHKHLDSTFQPRAAIHICFLLPKNPYFFLFIFGNSLGFFFHTIFGLLCCGCFGSGLVFFFPQHMVKWEGRAFLMLLLEDNSMEVLNFSEITVVLYREEATH